MRNELGIRVYYEDTDAGGVVYHAQYVKFMERARTEWLRELGFDQRVLRETDNLLFVVRSMELDFQAPARLDDELIATAELIHCGKASFTFAQTVERNGMELVKARVKVAAISATEMKPRGMPRELLDQLNGAMS